MTTMAFFDPFNDQNHDIVHTIELWGYVSLTLWAQNINFIDFVFRCYFRTNQSFWRRSYVTNIRSDMSTDQEKIEKEKLFDSLTCGICLDFFRWDPLFMDHDMVLLRLSVHFCHNYWLNNFSDIHWCYLVSMYIATAVFTN